MGEDIEIKDQSVPQPGLRFLEMAVYIMGGLLVLMLIGLIGGIAWKATHKKPEPLEEAVKLGLGLAPGTVVSQTTLDGDRLALTTATEVIVIDIRKGRVVARIALGGL